MNLKMDNLCTTNVIVKAPATFKSFLKDHKSGFFFTLGGKEKNVYYNCIRNKRGSPVWDQRSSLSRYKIAYL